MPRPSNMVSRPAAAPAGSARLRRRGVTRVVPSGVRLSDTVVRAAEGDLAPRHPAPPKEHEQPTRQNLSYAWVRRGMGVGCPRHKLGSFCFRPRGHMRLLRVAPSRMGRDLATGEGASGAGGRADARRISGGPRGHGVPPHPLWALLLHAHGGTSAARTRSEAGPGGAGRAVRRAPPGQDPRRLYETKWRGVDDAWLLCYRGLSSHG
jgi:hypothetical protein